MFAMAAARWSPTASADGSLKLLVSVVGAVDAGAGEGVAGGFAAVVVVVVAGCAGAAGAAGADGVDDVCAGVDGSAAGFGAALGFDVMQTMKPFSSILYDSMVLSSCKILPE